MKKAACILLLTFTLFSCSKEKDATIVGEWHMIARYAADNSGQFSWTTVSQTIVPIRLTFTPEGKFDIYYRDLADVGKYAYNYATKELRFESGQTANVTIHAVSYLDEDYLVIDRLSNGQLFLKEKYSRKK